MTGNPRQAVADEASRGGSSLGVPFPSDDQGDEHEDQDEGEDQSPEADTDDQADDQNADEPSGSAGDSGDGRGDSRAPAGSPSGGRLAGAGAGWVLGVLLWGWVVLPFVKGGPAQVGKTLRAKFLNQAPDGSQLP